VSLLPLKGLPRGRASTKAGIPEPRLERWRLPAGAVTRHLDPPLIAIISLAAFLRFWELGRVGLRGDEAVYAGQAAVLAGAKGYSPYFILQSRGDSNFLLFQEVVSAVYRVTGVSDLSARAVAATFSILTVIVTYLIGTALFGRRTGLFSALLLAVGGYAVMLGRLALLDSALTFLFATAMLCMIKWILTKRSGWLYGFAAAASLTIQAKIAGGLALLVAASYLLVNRSAGQLTRRRLLIAAGVFLIALTPVLVQLATNWELYAGFLSTSIRRASAVPWYYYAQVLLSHDGPFLLTLYTVGIAFAVGRRSRADLLPLLWVLTVAVFYQIYPLKAFNYLLPILPALAILSGRALDALVQRFRALSSLRAVSTAVLALMVVGAAAPYLRNTWLDDSYVGLKGAATWLAKSAPSGGVMTISRGSAQYAFAFYAHRDSYPFGRFNLATVLPGGRVVPASAPLPGARTPRDWVNRWPTRLIRGGQVSYLVYYTTVADDPPEESQVVETSTQRQFRLLIERYGGVLVHTVYYHHEGRAWVYRLTARLPRPILSYARRGAALTLRGSGFTENAAVTATYNGRRIAQAEANAVGSVTLSLRFPAHPRPRYLLTLTDASGRYASVTLPRPVIAYRTEHGIATVTGAGFQRSSPITVTYHGAVVAHARSAADGSVSVSFRQPARLFRHGQLVVTDRLGNHSSLVVLNPRLKLSVAGGRVTLHGSGYPPGELVTVLYHGRLVTSTNADIHGSISLSFARPPVVKPGWLLEIRDPADNYTTVMQMGHRP
jgi:4-amino-4-deoxy-L-arabinose transferase-like glycosyltransferase